MHIAKSEGRYSSILPGALHMGVLCSACGCSASLVADKHSVERQVTEETKSKRLGEDYLTVGPLEHCRALLVF